MEPASYRFAIVCKTRFASSRSSARYPTSSTTRTLGFRYDFIFCGSRPMASASFNCRTMSSSEVE